MKTSPAGLALIKRFEGLELEAYQDVAGVWTIGYGHTGPEVKPGLKWTEQVAEAALTRDVEWCEEAVASRLRVAINQNEFDALVSFVFNVGVGGESRPGFSTSTALKRLNAGDRAGAADALTWWNKATINGVLTEVTGLTRRRAAERELFLKPVAAPVETVMGDQEGCVTAPGKCAAEEPSIVAPEGRRNSKPFLRGLLCGHFW